MTIFDLLFAVLVLAGIATVLFAAGAAIRGRRARALALLRYVAAVAAVYLCVLIAVSALSPRPRVTVGEDQCSDDWCIAVQSVHRDSTAAGLRYDVIFRLSSRAGRISQRERFVVAYMRDRQGHRHDPVMASGGTPFDTLLAPRQVVLAARRFDLPSAARDVGIVIAREGAGRFPRCCIIGDRESLFHRRPVVPID